MRYVNYIVAIATLAGTPRRLRGPLLPALWLFAGPVLSTLRLLAGLLLSVRLHLLCAELHLRLQLPPSCAYRSRGDYYRNYNSIHAGPENYP